MRSESETGDPRLLGGFGALLAVVGIGLFAAGLWTIGRAFRAKAWPTVAGIVLSSEVDVHDGRNEVDEVPVTTYHPAVRYAYEVAGRRYVGERITFGDFGSTDLAARRTVAARYAEAAPVTVHYDPGAPEDAVLEPGPVAFNLLMPGLGLAFLLGGASIVREARALSVARRVARK